MKTVLPTRDVAHRWANQTQENARNGSNSVSFVGPVFRSYNTPIAAIVENAQGNKAFIVTTRSYSVTTSGKHMTAALDAIRGRTEPIFHVNGVGRGGRSTDDFEPSREILHYADRLSEMEAKRAKARKNREWWTDRIVSLMDEANDFARFFDLAPGYSQELVDAARREREHARAISIDTERTRNNAALDANRDRDIATLNERVALWRSGELYGLNYFQAEAIGGDILRLSSDGAEVETSRGANVPVAHARRLFAAWLAGVELRGMRVGHYTVDRADDNGIKIGCHYIERREAEMFATAQGWTNTVAA